MINTIFFSLLAIFSLFVFMNLGKIKASKKQTDRDHERQRDREAGLIKKNTSPRERTRIGLQLYDVKKKQV